MITLADGKYIIMYKIKEHKREDIDLSKKLLFTHEIITKGKGEFNIVKFERERTNGKVNALYFIRKIKA